MSFLFFPHVLNDFWNKFHNRLRVSEFKDIIKIKLSLVVLQILLSSLIHFLLNLLDSCLLIIWVDSEWFDLVRFVLHDLIIHFLRTTATLQNSWLLNLIALIIFAVGISHCNIQV